MARFRMEVEGAERLDNLMKKCWTKAEELRQAAEELMNAAGSLRLSGTLEQEEETSVRGITVELPSSSSRDIPPEAGENTSPKT